LFFGLLGGECPLITSTELEPEYRSRVFCSLFAIVLHGTRAAQGSTWCKPVRDPTHQAALASSNNMCASTPIQFPAGTVVVTAHGPITPRTPTENDQSWLLQASQRVLKEDQEIKGAKTFARFAICGTPIVVVGVSGTKENAGWNEALKELPVDAAEVGAKEMHLPQRLTNFVFDLLAPALEKNLKDLMIAYLNDDIGSGDQDGGASGPFWARFDFSILDLCTASNEISTMLNAKLRDIQQLASAKKMEQLLHKMTPGSRNRVKDDFTFDSDETLEDRAAQGLRNRMQSWMKNSAAKYPSTFVSDLRKRMQVRCAEDSCFAPFVDQIITYADQNKCSVGSLPVSITALDGRTLLEGKDYCKSCEVKMRVVSLVPYIMRILGLKSAEVLSLLEGYSAELGVELQKLVPLNPHSGKRVDAKREHALKVKKDNPSVEIHYHYG